MWIDRCPYFYGAIIRRKQNASTNRKKFKEEL